MEERISIGIQEWFSLNKIHGLAEGITYLHSFAESVLLYHEHAHSLYRYSIKLRNYQTLLLAIASFKPVRMILEMSRDQRNVQSLDSMCPHYCTFRTQYIRWPFFGYIYIPILLVMTDVAKTRRK